MTEVLLAFWPFATEERIAQLEAAVPGVTVRAAPYDLEHAARTEVAARPGDLAARARLPEPSAEHLEALRGAEAILALDGAPGLGSLAPDLRLVQTVGSGVGQWWVCDLDLERTALCNAAGLGAPAIAEWVLAQVLRVVKRIDRVAEQQRDRVWQQQFGDQLAGRRMAIVGLGEIGAALAVRSAAFGLEVHGVRRSSVAPPPGVVEVHHPDDLHALLARSEVVVGCLPGTSGTDDVFDAAAFAAMPADAIFVNVGRGGSVDEGALVDALTGGHLRAAVLDVTRAEPLPPDSPLWDCPRLHVSPHSAAAPGALLDAVWQRFIRNLAALRSGAPFEHRVHSTG